MSSSKILGDPIACYHLKQTEHNLSYCASKEGRRRPLEMLKTTLRFQVKQKDEKMTEQNDAGKLRLRAALSLNAVEQ